MSEKFVAQGTTVIVEPSHSVPLVSIVLALRIGSAHDPPGLDGLGRLALRSLRRGAEGLTSQEVESLLDRLGADMAVDTTTSSLAIHAQVIERNLDAFIDLLARLLGTATFPEDEFERLKRETIAEIIDGRDNDRAVAQKAFQRAIFAGHPYARSGGGTTTTVAATTRDHARDHIKKHLVRGNVVLAFAGDITAARARAITERLAAVIPEGAGSKEELTEPTLGAGRRLVFIDKPERTQTQIIVGTMGTSPHDRDHVALSVANAIFGGTFTSRLMKEVRSKRGWSYGASSRLSIDRKRQAFTMWTFPGASDAAKCIALELELLEAFLKEGITAEELTFIQSYLTRSYAFDVDTAPKRMHQALDVELLGLPENYYSAYREHVRAVTVEGANAAVRERLDSSKLIVAMVGTAEEILADVKAAIPGLGETVILPVDAE